MKLNLLPTTVSKGRQAQSAIFFSVIIAVAGLVIGGYLNVSSSKALDTARQDQEASIGPAQEAYNKSVDADTLMSLPTSVAVIRDASLAKAMIDHNDVYPALYDSLLPYIPAFYRINSISASSAGENANITLVGTIDTFQQYANLMLAFANYPGLISVSRSGFTGQDDFVPNIDTVDTVGKPRKQSEAPIPDDQLERLAYFQSTVQQEGYTGVGNFGAEGDNTRSAMPTASLVTVQLVVKKNLQVPDPRQTLTAGAGGAASPMGGMPGGMGPGGPGGMGPGGPPSGFSAPGARAGAAAAGADAAPTAGKKGKGGDDNGD